MGTLLRILVIVALWLLYIFFLTRACSPQLCEGCAPAAEAVSEVTRYPIDFAWNGPTAYTNAGYEAFRDNLLSQRGDDNVIEIIGLYYTDEEAPPGYPNMGLARAEAARRLLVPDLPDDRVLEKARRLYRQPEGIEDDYFEALAFRWLAPDNTIAPTIEELEDRIHIRFALDSDQMEYDSEVLEYLQELADELQDSTQVNLQLVGHTDNTGDSDYNQQLGLRRAEGIRERLIGFGLDSTRIEIISEGEIHPITTNDTEEGRHENRRVEIRNLR